MYTYFIWDARFELWSFWYRCSLYCLAPFVVQRTLWLLYENYILKSVYNKCAVNKHKLTRRKLPSFYVVYRVSISTFLLAWFLSYSTVNNFTILVAPILFVLCLGALTLTWILFSYQYWYDFLSFSYYSCST